MQTGGEINPIQRFGSKYLQLLRVKESNTNPCPLKLRQINKQMIKSLIKQETWASTELEVRHILPKTKQLCSLDSGRRNQSVAR